MAKTTQTVSARAGGTHGTPIVVRDQEPARPAAPAGPPAGCMSAAQYAASTHTSPRSVRDHITRNGLRAVGTYSKKWRPRVQYYPLADLERLGIRYPVEPPLGWVTTFGYAAQTGLVLSTARHNLHEMAVAGLADCMVYRPPGGKPHKAYRIRRAVRAGVK